VPATGFSVGVSRLLAALQVMGSPLVAGLARPGPVVVLVMDRDQIARYQGFVAQLRAAGIAAELYLGQAGMNAQLKYADKRNSRCAVIQGSNERDKGEVVIKDLVAGAALSKAAKDMAREDYLALKERAQFAVPEARLVEAVKDVLGR
jgi:histidyl-tRNA synthetase